MATTTAGTGGDPVKEVERRQAMSTRQETAQSEAKRLEAEAETYERRSLAEAQVLREREEEAAQASGASQAAYAQHQATTKLAQRNPGDQGSPQGTGMDQRLANDPERIADERRAVLRADEAKSQPSDTQARAAGAGTRKAGADTAKSQRAETETAPRSRKAAGADRVSKKGATEKRATKR